MPALTGNPVKNTYINLLQVPTNNIGLSTTLVQLQDGGGNTIPGWFSTSLVQFQAGTFTIADASDPTKLLKFLVSGITSGQTRTLTVPDSSDTIALLSATQTLTGKTISGASNTLTVRLGSDVTGTLLAANFPALTGDVTTPGASLASTIANNAVTYAKFQQVAANKVLGNSTGSTANVAEIPFGAANGVATLDGSGKLTSSQIPNSLTGAVVYQGTWNANTNTPTLASGTGTKGNYYKVSVAGSTTIDTISSWNVGDTIIFDGTTWDKIDGVTNEVLSVAGRTGAVTLSFSDLSGQASAAQLPNPTASTLGGIESYVAVSHQFITSISTSGVPTSAQPAFTDISGTASAVQLPNPTTSALGGVQAINAVSHQWINSINTSGVPQLSQPAFSDVSGSVASGQMPALTGDITTSAGTVATTLATVNSQVGTYNGFTLNAKGLVTAAVNISAKASCRAATTGALTVTYANGTAGVGATLTNAGTQAALSLDGVTMAVNDRVLVKNQGAPAQNGIYTVTNIGSGSTNWVMTRATDFDNSTAGNVYEGAMTPITEGTLNAGSIFVETGSGPFTLGTTAITWTLNSASSSYANLPAIAAGTILGNLGSSSTSPSAVYLGNYIDVRNYSCVPDARRISDIVTTNGSATATSAAQGAFTANDVGKRINIYDFANSVFVFQGTISAVGSATSITLSSTASASCTTGHGTAWIGTDNATNIASAITAANALVPTSSIDANHPLGTGRITILFPTDSRGAAYMYHSAGLTFGTNTVIDADAMLVNETGTSGLSNRTWGMTLNSGASIKNLEMDCCQGMGITCGTNATQSHAFIDKLTLWEVGGNFNGGLSPTGQLGLQLNGNDYHINRFWVKGANTGLNGNQNNDTRINQAFVIGCGTGALITSNEELYIGDLQVDTGSFEGLTIDGSHNIKISSTCFAINGTVNTYGMAIGSNDAVNICHNLDIHFNVERSGSTAAVYLNNYSDSILRLNITNAANYAGGGAAMPIAIKYGSGIAGSVLVDASVDGSITTINSGTVVGNVRVNGHLQQTVGTFASTYVWNPQTNPNLQLTLTGAITMSAPSPMLQGFYQLELIENGTGGFAVTWNAAFHGPAGSMPSITTTANKKNILGFWCDGTNFYCLYSSMGLA